MENKKSPIGLKKENDLLSFCISLFGILQKEAHDKDLVIEGNKITVRKKDPSEINKLNLNYEPLRNKILDWFHDKSTVLLLDEQESDTLRDCIHAAYYFTTEKAPKEQSPQFLKYYNYLKSINAL